MGLIQAAQRAVMALNRSGVDYALCGGLAVAAHGNPRSTRDIDVVVATEVDARRILGILADDGWVINPNEIAFPDGFVLHRALLVEGKQPWMLDVLVEPAGSGHLSGRILSELEGCACWVVSREQLIAMKRSAGRPIDLHDIQHLEGLSP
jgi:hypothetical protein